MSAADFVKLGYADFFYGHRPSVSHVAFHFRELVKSGGLVDVAWRKSGSTVATVYRGAARVRRGHEPVAALPASEKSHISRAIAQGLIARLNAAFATETFHRRDNRRLSWSSMRLDERGWGEVHDILSDAFAAVDKAGKDAGARLDENDEEGITTTAGVIFFESPALSGSPSEDTDIP
jgi:hypothetical protein